MAQGVIDWLHDCLVVHWPRKLLSLALAIAVWIVLDHSMTASKSFANVPVRIVNLPQGKTIEGRQANGLLQKKVNITLVGNRTRLEELSNKDLEVLLDANNKPDSWTARVDKENLICLNGECDLKKTVSRMSPLEIPLRQSKLSTEKIPVLITQPIGEAPKGYQFLDVWPYKLQLSVQGPEDEIKRLKARGLKLTFNLNDVSRTELDTLQAKGDEVSFFVPNSWKKILVPQISDTPIEIDDLMAKSLRLDFSRQDLLPIEGFLPVTVFFPQKFKEILNPKTHALKVGGPIVEKSGILTLATPLYAQGVSRLFLETVKDMMQIVIIANPKAERDKLLWNVQFMYPHELENRYVARVLASASDEAGSIQPQMREDYLRNRFRSYMDKFRLYTSDKKKLSLQIELDAHSINVSTSS